ncbi:MAG: isoamylase early set domain-containing protein [Bacteroidales bacterium]|nr:isoamylase early set domain-containing protein [Bacteroidales bacterium]
MSLKKTYSEKKPECKVTFKLESDKINGAAQVNLAGEFNSWNEHDTPMKQLKNGDFSVTLTLEKGKEYQYKYLINSKEWINDPEADKYLPNAFQGDNSVVVV